MRPVSFSAPRTALSPVISSLVGYSDPEALKALLARLPRTSIVIALLAIALYLPGFWWGAPYATAPDRTHSWGVDDETPLGAIGQAFHVITHTPGGNLGYPSMYYFVVAVANTPYLAYLWVTGQFGGVSATYPFGLSDPVDSLQILTWVAHLVSVLMGAGIVIAAYDAARVLWDQRTGIFAALFAMLSYPMFFYSRTGNVDVPTLFFSAVALNAIAHIIRRGFSMRHSVRLGTFVGLALATKESTFALFVAFPIVLPALQWRDEEPRAAWHSLEFWKPSLVAVLTATVAFGLGSGLFVDPQRYFAHVDFAQQRLRELAAGNVYFLPYFTVSWEGNIRLGSLIIGYLVDAMTLAGVLLSALGVLFTLRREPRTTLFALAAVTYLIVLFWSARTAQLRYVMPAAFVLSFFSARCLTVALKSKQYLLRASALAVGVAVLSVSLLRGVDLTFQMINDSRYAAAVWLATHTQTGDHVEYFGYTDHLPPLPAGVITFPAIEFLGVTQKPHVDQAAFEEVRSGWAIRKPRYVIIVPDLTSTENTPYSGVCPPQVFAGLSEGTLGYQLVAFFQTPSLFPWLTRPLLDYPVVNPPIYIFERVSPVSRTESPHSPLLYPAA